MSQTFDEEATLSRIKLEKDLIMDGDLKRVFFSLARGEKLPLTELSDEDFAVVGPVGLNLIKKGAHHLALTNVGENCLVGKPAKVKTPRHRVCPKAKPLMTGVWAE